MNYNIIVKPGKGREFVQVLGSIIDKLEKDKKCLSCDFKRNDKIKDHYCLYSEWQDIEALKKHFLTDLFSLLQGAIAVLCNPPEIEISDGTIQKIIDFNIRDNEYREEQIHDRLNAVMMEFEGTGNTI